MKEKNIKILRDIIAGVIGLFIIVFPNFFSSLSIVIKISFFVCGTTFIIGYYLRNSIFLDYQNNILGLNIAFISILLVLFVFAMLTPSDVDISFLNKLVPSPTPITITVTETITSTVTETVTIEVEVTPAPINTPDSDMGIPLYELNSIDDYNIEIHQTTNLETNNGENIKSYYCSLDKNDEYYSSIVYFLDGEYKRFTGIFTITDYDTNTYTLGNNIKIFADDKRIFIATDVSTGDIYHEIDLNLTDCKELTIWLQTDTKNAVLADPTLYKIND